MAAWIFALLVAVAPPGRVPSRETLEAGEERYRSISADIAAVVTDQPPIFAGARGREQTAALLVAVAALESGLRVDVDDGRKRGPARECGLWQVMPGSAGAPPNGRCPETRREGAAVALELMRRSFSACRAAPVAERLAAYTSGSCSRGLAESRARVELARRLVARHPPPVNP
jgi:hypothetical protein